MINELQAVSEMLVAEIVEREAERTNHEEALAKCRAELSRLEAIEAAIVTLTETMNQLKEETQTMLEHALKREKEKPAPRNIVFDVIKDGYGRIDRIIARPQNGN